MQREREASLYLYDTDRNALPAMEMQTWGEAGRDPDLTRFMAYKPERTSQVPSVSRTDVAQRRARCKNARDSPQMRQRFPNTETHHPWEKGWMPTNGNPE